MDVSSRTPEGRPIRCPVCRGWVWVVPSCPPGDAPCPRCGCLLWFPMLDSKAELAEEPFPLSVSSLLYDAAMEAKLAKQSPLHIVLRFHGGCRDGLVMAGDFRDVSRRFGYRYNQFARQASLGSTIREVPTVEYPEIREVLRAYGPAAALSDAEVRKIAEQLQHLPVHVYEVTERTERSERIVMRLTFLREEQGL